MCYKRKNYLLKLNFLMEALKCCKSYLKKILSSLPVHPFYQLLRIKRVKICSKLILWIKRKSKIKLIDRKKKEKKYNSNE